MRSVLLVENDPDLCLTLGDILQATGYQVLSAEHGAAALPLIRASPDAFIVLIEDSLPQMDGQHLLAALAALPDLVQRHAYLFLTTRSNALPPSLTALLQQLQVGIVGMPFDLDNFLHAVAEAARHLDAPA
jgi:CheY-like chemotaxis protein